MHTDNIVLSIIATKQIAYEVKKHWLRQRSFRVIVGVYLLDKELRREITAQDLAKLFGVKSFRSEVSLLNAIDSGYLYNYGLGTRNFKLTTKGIELMERYIEQCELLQKRFNAIIEAERKRFDLSKWIKT